MAPAARPASTPLLGYSLTDPPPPFRWIYILYQFKKLFARRRPHSRSRTVNPRLCVRIPTADQFPRRKNHLQNFGIFRDDPSFRGPFLDLFPHLKNGFPGRPEVLHLLERSTLFIHPEVPLLNHVLVAYARFVHVVKYDHGHNYIRVRKALPACQEKSQGRRALRVLRDTFGVLMNS